MPAEARAVPPAGWSRVDDGPDPGRLITGRDRLARDPFFEVLHRRLLELLAACRGELALDVGCGTGEAVSALAAGGVRAVGIDRSRRMLEEARRRHPVLRLVMGDARHLPIACGRGRSGAGRTGVSSPG
ncbi:MAG: methyltransferase domain-containing protein [Acidimicrobiia bacterium]|nr:methyltransferase domain-containing protein [Acidimicrobiia bacterium]